MYDEPSAADLIDATRTQLESNIIPVIRGDRKLYFQTLVAINVLKIVGREMQLGAGHLSAEWQRLNDLLEEDTAMPSDYADLQAALSERNRTLGTAIRDGEHDNPAQHSALITHLKATVQEQLEVANPRFLQMLAQEDNQSEEEQ